MRINNNVSELVGGTPLLRLNNVERLADSGACILAKLECFNPAGSAKDRPALAMIRRAEEQGLLTEGSVIIEPTSGNTGIGLAAIGASLGYRVIIVMPDSMSQERIKLMKLYGAEVVLTPGADGMTGSIREAERLASEIPDAFIPSQFDNPANPMAHYETTGPEIWEDTEGKVDILVAGIGTGGTLSGTGRYLKEKNPDVQVIGVEPASSPLITEGRAGKHRIQGIGANFIPDNLDKNIYDEVITVSDDDAYKYAMTMARIEGVAVGISSGAALSGAIEIGKRPENEGKTIVVIMTDTGERYLSALDI